MAIAGGEPAQVEEEYTAWRQGDATLDAELEFTHLADLTKPATQQSIDTAAVLKNEAQECPTSGLVSDMVSGFVLLTQTCDIVRDVAKRPYVEIAPLVRVEQAELAQIQKMKLPNRAYVPGLADKCLVADLDRTMTIEKPILAKWKRIAGCRNDTEVRALQDALMRKRGRFAFPDDFEGSVNKLQKRMVERAGKNSVEGSYVDALLEIRVRAMPSWDAPNVQLEFWFIKDRNPPSTKEGEPEGNEWPKWSAEWVGLFNLEGRFTSVQGTVSELEYMTASDLLGSDRLDLDRLSIEG